jgi:hypothetical protein
VVCTSAFHYTFVSQFTQKRFLGRESKGVVAEEEFVVCGEKLF